MNKYAKIVVHLIRWTVCVTLIWKTTNMMFANSTFQTTEEGQMYVLKSLLLFGSISIWMLFTIYLFPDQYTREDGLSQWLDAKIGREWRRL